MKIWLDVWTYFAREFLTLFMLTITVVQKDVVRQIIEENKIYCFISGRSGKKLFLFITILVFILCVYV